MGLDGESKTARAVRHPLRKGCFFYQLTKREVHLDGVELCCIVAQKFRLCQFLRIKIRLPTRIRPSRSTCKQLRHVSADYTARLFFTTVFAEDFRGELLFFARADAFALDASSSSSSA